LQANISEGKLLDLRISGDGSKIFCINMELIQVWDMWTGEAVGRVQNTFGYKSLAMDSLKVWIENELGGCDGWDFGITESPPVEFFTQPPGTLNLNGTRLWDNRQCRIQDTATGKVVFQLPERFQGHIVEAQWNGQYLGISLRSEKELILELPLAFL